MTFYFKKAAVVVPAFNEEKTIGQVAQALKKITPKVIVVNDGSTDQTAKKALKAGALVINHQLNQGYDCSLEDGFKEAFKQKAEIIATFDADGQHQTADLIKLIQLIINGQAKIAAGQRPTLNHLAEKLFAFYTKKRFGIKDPLCGLKAYSANVYQKIGHFDTLQSIGTQLLLQGIKKGFSAAVLPIKIKKRPGQSRFYQKKLKANWKIFKAMVKIIWRLELDT